MEGTNTYTADTEANGVAQLSNMTIPAGLTELSCSGGSYMDEATGVKVSPAPRTRAATHYSGTGDLTLIASALSEIAVQIAGADLSEIDTINAAVASAFGLADIDIVTTMPVDLNAVTDGTIAPADTAGQRIGLINAAISQIAENIDPATAIATVLSNLETTIQAIITDIADGMIQDNASGGANEIATALNTLIMRADGSGIELFNTHVTITEGLSASASNAASLTINVAPIANAGNDETVDEDTSFNLIGRGTEHTAGESVTDYMWNTDSDIVLSNASLATTAFTPAEPGTYTFSLVVTNDQTPAVSSAADEVVITVRDVNDAPTITATAHAVFRDQSVAIQVQASDPDPTAPNNTLAYAIISGNTASVTFVIDAATGQITNPTLTDSDFDTGPTHRLIVEVTDGGSPTLTATATITINLGNQAPTDIALSTTSIAADAGTGTVVGVLTATDRDANNNNFSYAATNASTVRIEVEEISGSTGGNPLPENEVVLTRVDGSTLTLADPVDTYNQRAHPAQSLGNAINALTSSTGFRAESIRNRGSANLAQRQDSGFIPTTTTRRPPASGFLTIVGPSSAAGGRITIVDNSINNRVRLVTSPPGPETFGPPAPAAFSVNENNELVTNSNLSSGDYNIFIMVNDGENDYVKFFTITVN